MRTGRNRLTTKRLLGLLWACFIARGLFYCALLPVWEGFDEPYHFSYLQYVVVHHAAPSRSDAVSREVEASFHLMPLSWEQRLHGLSPPIYTEEAYWALTEEKRQDVQWSLRNLPWQWAAQPAARPLNYEAQQPPLYYFVFALPLRLLWHTSLPAQVICLRMLGVLIASALIPLGFVASRAFFPGDGMAIGTVAVIVCLPELMINLARVANECLPLLIYTLLFLVLVAICGPALRPRLLALAGVLLGLGLLSKAYFLTSVPVFLAISAWLIWRRAHERARIILWSVAGLLLAFVIASPWYWRVYQLTGTLSGEQDDIAAARIPWHMRFAAIAHVNWKSGAISVLLSHIWFGGWSFLRFPNWIYLCAGVLVALAAAGVAVFLLRGLGTKSHDTGYPLRGVLVAGFLYALFWLGLLYHVFVIYVATGVSASTGWYLYSLVVPEMLLLVVGLQTLTPSAFRRYVPVGLAVFFATLDLYGMYSLLIPYYTGAIAHIPDTDVLRPLEISRLAALNPHLVVARLCADKPVALCPVPMVLLQFGYLASTVAAVWLSWFALGQQPSSAAHQPR